MLVWLASYPRSGNTLLRQVLKTCFDLDSCEGLELVPENLRDPDGTRYRHYGTYYLDNNWEEFYQKSRDSKELVLVKTHGLPRDDAKAIYVVRDGRLAIKSFVKFQDSYHPGVSSFASLLLGDHQYGEWTSHYRAWSASHKGPRLLLRFEELVNPNAETLVRIAGFLGLPGPIHPWVSHLDELRERHPGYFGPGHPLWKPDPFWTEARLRQFYTLHGGLLTELGYATEAEAKAGAYPTGSDEEQVLLAAQAVVAHRDSLQAECDERQAKIDGMKKVCDERESAILQLTSETQNHIVCREDLHRRLREADAKLRPLRRFTLLGLLSRFIMR